MKSYVEKIRESIPTLVVFQHAGMNDAVEVKYLLKTLKEKFAGKANIETVDCSYNGNLKMKYKLKEYPTYILFKENQELARESGKKTEAKLEEMMQSGIN